MSDTEENLKLLKPFIYRFYELHVRYCLTKRDRKSIPDTVLDDLYANMLPLQEEFQTLTDNPGALTPERGYTLLRSIERQYGKYLVSVDRNFYLFDLVKVFARLLTSDPDVTHYEASTCHQRAVMGVLTANLFEILFDDNVHEQLYVRFIESLFQSIEGNPAYANRNNYALNETFLNLFSRACTLRQFPECVDVLQIFMRLLDGCLKGVELTEAMKQNMRTEIFNVKRYGFYDSDSTDSGYESEEVE